VPFVPAKPCREEPPNRFHERFLGGCSGSVLPGGAAGVKPLLRQPLLRQFASPDLPKGYPQSSRSPSGPQTGRLGILVPRRFRKSPACLFSTQQPWPEA
jgi:hypothetical protein